MITMIAMNREAMVVTMMISQRMGYELRSALNASLTTNFWGRFSSASTLACLYLVSSNVSCSVLN
jgi:hypothetical protein